VGLLFVSTQSMYALQSSAFEKVRDVSPDGKFALRIRAAADLITTAELDSLPSKTGRTQIT
jgi:hypothetical protein